LDGSGGGGGGAFATAVGGRGGGGGGIVDTPGVSDGAVFDGVGETDNTSFKVSR